MLRVVRDPTIHATVQGEIGTHTFGDSAVGIYSLGFHSVSDVSLYLCLMLCIGLQDDPRIQDSGFCFPA